jgi:large subunit ribosomal protein L19
MTSTAFRTLATSYEKKRPDIAPGYTVRVHERIREGERERVQIFEGLVIGLHRGHIPTDTTFTVRRIASGVGVERIFALHSPAIEKIDVKKIAKVRRAKLTFLRGRRGKSARMSERFTGADEFAIAVAAPEQPAAEEQPAAGTAEAAAETPKKTKASKEEKPKKA